jgi:hypothetical protein
MFLMKLFDRSRGPFGFFAFSRHNFFFPLVMAFYHCPTDRVTDMGLTIAKKQGIALLAHGQ